VYVGLLEEKRGDLLNEKVCLALEVLMGDWLMERKGRTDSRQYFYFIKIYYLCCCQYIYTPYSRPVIVLLHKISTLQIIKSIVAMKKRGYDGQTTSKEKAIFGSRDHG
jgi:hypothetical protein